MIYETEEKEVHTDLHPAWKQAVEDFLRQGFTYGDVVPLEWLFEAFGIQKPGPEVPNSEFSPLILAFGEQLGPFRSVLLEEHLMDLQKETSSHDYIIVQPGDQVPRAFKEGMRILKTSVKKTARRMGLVATDMLTQEELARDARLSARFSQVRASVMRRPREITKE